MAKFVVYDEQGKILRGGVCNNTEESIQSQASELGESAMEVDDIYDDTLFWVDNGTISPKTSLDVIWNKTVIQADDIDEAVLSGLPIPCTVLLDWEEVLVEDGSFEFSTLDPGFYSVIVDHPQYLREEWSIEAE